MRTHNLSTLAKPIISATHAFTLIEVLIAFIILTVGLLGTVALQTRAKQASYDANQRSAALALANDIIERVRSNDSSEVLAQYNQILSHDSPPIARNCLNTQCSLSDITAYDLYQWHKALRMADNTGTLANGVVCINNEFIDNKLVELHVVIAWQGRQQIEEHTNKHIACGSLLNRRTVVFESYIFVRSA